MRLIVSIPTTPGFLGVLEEQGFDFDRFLRAITKSHPWLEIFA